MIPKGTFAKVVSCSEPSLRRFIGQTGEVVRHGSLFNIVEFPGEDENAFPSGNKKAFLDSELLISTESAVEATTAIARILSAAKMKACKS